MQDKGCATLLLQFVTHLPARATFLASSDWKPPNLSALALIFSSTGSCRNNFTTSHGYELQGFSFRKMENLFLNLSGVPSWFSSDDFFTMTPNFAYQLTMCLAMFCFFLKSSRRRMICSSKNIFLNPAYLHPAVKYPLHQVWPFLSRFFRRTTNSISLWFMNLQQVSAVWSQPEQGDL